MSAVDLKRLKVESKKRFTLPQEREPRAVKEEEALVRTVRVVRGSGFSTGVSAGILTAKCLKIAKVLMACFSSFVLFALFAVHRIQRECPLYF